MANSEVLSFSCVHIHYYVCGLSLQLVVLVAFQWPDIFTCLGYTHEVARVISCWVIEHAKLI